MDTESPHEGGQYDDPDDLLDHTVEMDDMVDQRGFEDDREDDREEDTEEDMEDAAPPPPQFHRMLRSLKQAAEPVTSPPDASMSEASSLPGRRGSPRQGGQRGGGGRIDSGNERSLMPRFPQSTRSNEGPISSSSSSGSPSGKSGKQSKAGTGGKGGKARKVPKKGTGAKKVGDIPWGGSCARWRVHASTTGTGAFEGWTVALCGDTAPPPSFLRRVLLAGGAAVHQIPREALNALDRGGRGWKEDGGEMEDMLKQCNLIWEFAT